MWGIPNVYAQQRSSQSTTGNKSPAVIAGGDVTIIYKDAIKPPPSLLGLPEFDSAYKIAVSFKAAENWKKAAELFSTIYRKKPDYPTLAMNYSICLSKLGKNDEAFAVMLSIPNTEHYQFLNFNKGITLYKLKRYSEASKYLKLAMKDYRKNDCRYWDARALLIVSQYLLSSSLTGLIKDTNEFIAVVRSDVRQLNDYQSNAAPDHEVNTDEVQEEVLSRKNAAFYLLRLTSTLMAQLDRFDEALSFALKAADQLEGPTEGSVLEVDDIQYEDFLAHLSFVLSRSKDRVRFSSTVDYLMDKIECHNHAIRQQVIAELAMLIRAFYGTSKSINGLCYGKFKITYSVKTNDDGGLKQILFESPDYLLGKGSIYLNGVKEYVFERSIIFSSKVSLNVKPYLRYIAEDTSGNVTRVELVPTIAVVK
jgi:tetratricopeptide (TPR) repeat protein